MTSLAGCEGAEVSGPDRPARLLDGDDTLDGGSDLDGGASGPLDSGGTAADAAEISCSPTLASIQSTLFQPRCAMVGCHVGKSAAAALDLTRSDLSTLLVSVSASSCSGQTLVVPGNPDASFLVSKISGHVPTGCGDPMPPAGTAVAPNLLECVRGYIRGLPAAMTDAGMIMECGSGQSLCAGACVDQQTDPKHCGTCTTACGPNQLCTPTGCAGGCGSLTQCGSACVDTSTSLTNCGGCGMVCGAGKACVQGKCACAGGPVSFSQVSQILADSCTNSGCHAGMMPKEGLNLSVGKAYAELVNVKASQCNDGRLLVASGGSGPSYLLQKLSGQGLCSGTQMPKAGVSLAPSELTLIQNWVCNGAQP